MLFITLPSGRKLCYVKPRIQTNRFGGDGLTYEGVGESKKWTRIETFGGKLTENIVQATARDLLAEAMLRLHRAHPMRLLGGCCGTDGRHMAALAARLTAEAGN